MITVNTDYSFISPYPVMILLSFLAGAVGMFLLNIRRGVRRDIAKYLMILAPLMSLFGGAALTYLSSHGEYIGLSSVGGLAGMYAAVLTMGLISPEKGDMKIMAESCTVMLPLMYSVSKIGCLCAGCCRGIAYAGICSVHYTGINATEGSVLPVQGVETLVFLCIFLIGLAVYLRGKKHAVPLIFVCAALAKFALDFLRESHVGVTVSFTQWLCLLLTLIGSVWLILGFRKGGTHAG